MLASMASFTLPNPALVRTVRLASGRTAFTLGVTKGARRITSLFIVCS